MQANRRRPALLALVCLLAASCVTTSNKPQNVSAQPVGEDGWVLASPVLQEQIDDEAKRLPWTHGFERLEQIRWFASVGEPAYDKLLALATDPRDDVAAAALAALGATLDHRLVPHVRALPWDAERSRSDLGLERARTLLRLGDWSEIPTLIAGLSDARVYTRSLCFDALQEATHETLGYDPRGSENVRETAIERWNRWWQARADDALLGQSR